VSTAARQTFRPADRLKKLAEFEAVYGAKAVKRAGPLRVHAMPNERGHHRLGLSVGGRAGGAVVRARIKRMLRESFRLTRQNWPAAYDVVVVSHAHEPATLDDYQRWLAEAVEQLHRHWVRRSSKQD
jgi:ribonuclease P protein component